MSSMADSACSKCAWQTALQQSLTVKVFKHFRSSLEMCICCVLAPSCALQLEVTLGRIAMIGFVGLILNEAYFGRPFFPHLF